MDTPEERTAGYIEAMRRVVALCGKWADAERVPDRAGAFRTVYCWASLNVLEAEKRQPGATPHE